MILVFEIWVDYILDNPILRGHASMHDLDQGVATHCTMLIQVVTISIMTLIVTIISMFIVT